MKRMLWVLVAALALVLSLPAAAAQGKSQGKGKAEAKGKSAEKEKGKSEQEREREKERERLAARGRAFGKAEIRIIREWFGKKSNLEGLPPGLAKRHELPPGLQRHLERYGTLPPGLQKRLHPLPRSLRVRLPKTPAGVERVIVAGSVILMEKRTSKILDIIDDVMGGGRAKRGSTGVRRIRDE